jgi:uncharacterized protein (DUF1778 family)
MRQSIEYLEEDVAKKERLEARTTLPVKKLIQQAAVLEGRSVSDFVVDHAQEAARGVLERHNNISLSVSDSVRFVEALMNPPAPNERLQRAAKRHKELIKNR